MGSYLLKQYPGADRYNSKNFRGLAGKTYDHVLFCGIPAVKWYANKHPEEDLTNIQVLLDVLEACTCTTTFLLV